LAITPTLATVEALFRKLERESYRAYHAHSKIHKADHFFNFCVTAHGMRDYLLEHLGKVTPQDKTPFYKQWEANSILVAVSEIANSSKHFCLRDSKTNLPKRIKTRRVTLRKSKFIDVYVNSEGDLKLVERLGNDIAVTLSDGSYFELHAFTGEVLKYWKATLLSHGIHISKQPFARLQGTLT
jgi:hypothetical protein